MAAQQCNTIETLKQVIEENAGKLGAASNEAQHAILDVCSKFPEELTGHAYTHSAATLAEVGIALSVALMTEIAPIGKPLDSFGLHKQYKESEEKLRVRMANAVSHQDPSTESILAGFEAKWEKLSIRLKAAKGYFLYALYKGRKFLALLGLCMSMLTLWLMAYGHTHSKDLIIGIAFVACAIQGLPVILLKNHKAEVKEKP